MSLSYLVLLYFGIQIKAQYTPDWESLDSRPLPEWYDKSKIGIFMHFGVYSVPAFGGAWFWKSWHDGRDSQINFMKENYPPKFTYQDFGSQLSMEFFDANRIADIVAESGAKYLVFTSKHHEGFCNWPSNYSFGWNSMDIGPKRDVLMELKNALNERHPDVKFGVYYSLFEWYHPLYMKDKKKKFESREFVENKMIPEMKELIQTYAPYVLWADGDWEATPEYFGSKEFLAWLYNESPSKDYIVTNDRWGIHTGKKHGGFWSGPDKWSPGVLIDHKWESAMIVDTGRWAYRRTIQLSNVITPENLIKDVVTTVSCGGNILVNVGPTKEGTIIPIFEERLKQMGAWLKKKWRSHLFNYTLENSK